MVIHEGEFSPLLVRISLLKMWHIGLTPERLDWNVVFKNISSFLFLVVYPVSHNTTLKNKYANIYFIIPDYFIIPLPSHNSFCSSSWIISHPLSLGLKIQWKYYCVKIIFCVIADTLLKENQLADLAVSIMGRIRKTSHGHMASILCVSGTVDIPGCGHRLHSRGMGMPGPRSAGIVHRRDVRELREPGLLGWG